MNKLENLTSEELKDNFLVPCQGIGSYRVHQVSSPIHEKYSHRNDSVRDVFIDVAKEEGEIADLTRDYVDKIQRIVKTEERDLYLDDVKKKALEIEKLYLLYKEYGLI